MSNYSGSRLSAVRSVETRNFASLRLEYFIQVKTAIFTNPQSPVANPQSLIPNPQPKDFLKNLKGQPFPED